MDAIVEDTRLPTAIDAQPVVRAAAAMRPKLRDYSGCFGFQLRQQS